MLHLIECEKGRGGCSRKRERKGRRGGKLTGQRLISDSGGQALLNAALDQFAIPGDASFPLNQAFEAPRDRQDAESLRQ